MIGRYLSTVVCAAGMVCPAVAQERPVDGWEVSVGGGALVAPIYLGDDDYAVSVVPSIRVNYQDRFFASVENGIGYNLINNDALRAGPLMTIDFGRNEDSPGPFQVSGGDRTDLIGLGDIDTTVSLGGFVEFDIGDFELSVQAGQALGGHDGLTGELGLAYKTRIQRGGPPVILSFGPRMKLGDDTYANAFFGVTPAQSTASGLLVHDAEGGVISYGVSATAIMPLTQRATLTTIASFDRMSDNIADAPLVALRGSEDQAFLGLVLGWRL